ncbi:multidrug resistance protein, putative, partial [Ixodes scapularis]
ALWAMFVTFLLVSPAHQLTPSLTFPCLSFFLLLRFPMYTLPDIVSKFIRRATFGLSEYDTPVLEDVDLNFKAGSLVAIVGAVGSGKSALLSAILGTIKRTSGSVDVKGRLAYVAQQPWIQNATLKENIVFTNPSDDHRFRQIVEACALTPDLDMLPEGDATYVGDRTRLFVTHSTAYLPAVDWIVFLDKGRVGEQGTYDELLARTENKFSKFLRNHSTRKYSEDHSESAAEDTGK